MNKFLSILSKPVTIILLVLLADQGLKIWIKTHLLLSEEIPMLGNWFIIHFVENKGMAFGWEIPFFSPDTAKIVLTIFRILAVCGIGYYLFNLPKKSAKGLKISIALIFAGAIGNIIDSAFYGVLFNHSYGQVATFLSDEGGYSSFLQGWVVDMFYFPLFEGNFPTWFPYWGGEHFLFFRPVFNLADASISIGIALVFLFQKRYFKKTEEETVSSIETT